MAQLAQSPHIERDIVLQVLADNTDRGYIHMYRDNMTYLILFEVLKKR
jgi:hypothetical protein